MGAISGIIVEYLHVLMGLSMIEARNGFKLTKSNEKKNDKILLILAIITFENAIRFSECVCSCLNQNFPIHSHINQIKGEKR